MEPLIIVIVVTLLFLFLGSHYAKTNNWPMFFVILIFCMAILFYGLAIGFHFMPIPLWGQQIINFLNRPIGPQN